MRLSFVTGGSLIVTLSIVAIAMFSQFPEAATADHHGQAAEPYARMVISGDNVYIVWSTNSTGNWEVMFRASDDHGYTFGDKVNLSNSSETDSVNADITAEGYRVFVSWWESSQIKGTGESVMRMSEDNGITFGPLIELSSNGTIFSGDGTTTGNLTP
jgi:hypothetical protein